MRTVYFGVIYKQVQDGNYEYLLLKPCHNFFEAACAVQRFYRNLPIPERTQIPTSDLFVYSASVPSDIPLDQAHSYCMNTIEGWRTEINGNIFIETDFISVQYPSDL